MNTSPHLTLTGTLCAMGNLGADDLATIHEGTPRISFQLPGDHTVHLVGLTREHVISMAPGFYQPVRITVQPVSERERLVGEVRQLVADTAKVEAEFSDWVLAPAIHLPPTETVREMLFDSIDRLTDTSAAVDMYKERRDQAGARELIALRRAQATLAQVRQAVQDYHYALDTRQSGDQAQSRALTVICEHLDMPWQQGAELARRGGSPA